MAYSRWGNGCHWYTYWQSGSGESAMFVIQNVANFTAKQLRDNLNWCIDLVKKIDQIGDTEELKIYIAEFLSEVDNEENLDSDLINFKDKK